MPMRVNPSHSVAVQRVAPAGFHAPGAVHAGPDAFGAQIGRVQAALGEATQHAGAQIAQSVDSHMLRRQTTRMLDNLTKMQDELRDFDTEFRSQNRGKAALGAPQAYAAKLEELNRKYGQGISDPRVRLDYDRKFGHLRAGALHHAAEYGHGEERRWRADVSDKLFHDVLGKAADPSVSHAEARANFDEWDKADAALHSGYPGVRESRRAERLQRFHIERVEASLAAKRAGEARRYVRDNVQELGGASNNLLMRIPGRDPCMRLRQTALLKFLPYNLAAHIQRARLGPRLGSRAGLQPALGKRVPCGGAPQPERLFQLVLRIGMQGFERVIVLLADVAPEQGEVYIRRALHVPGHDALGKLRRHLGIFGLPQSPVLNEPYGLVPGRPVQTGSAQQFNGGERIGRLPVRPQRQIKDLRGDACRLGFSGLPRKRPHVRLAGVKHPRHMQGLICPESELSPPFRRHDAPDGFLRRQLREDIKGRAFPPLLLLRFQPLFRMLEAADLLARVKPGIKDVLREIREQMRQDTEMPHTAPAASSPPKTPPRQPDETPAAYLQRLGAAQ